MQWKMTNREIDPDTVYNARDAVKRFEAFGLDIPTPILAMAAVELEGDLIWSREPNCRHQIIVRWSGIECTVCHGTFCY
jgi:hypothetical protein